MDAIWAGWREDHTGSFREVRNPAGYGEDLDTNAAFSLQHVGTISAASYKSMKIEKIMLETHWGIESSISRPHSDLSI